MAALILPFSMIPLASAKSITLNGITFSDEHGGIELRNGWGSGAPEDPFVLIEDITEAGDAILTIRGLSPRFGNPLRSHHAAGFKLRKIVHNKTEIAWPIFGLELREYLSVYSPYEDGLSFGQGTTAGRPFASDSYRETQEIEEPFDSVSFTGGTVPPGGTVVITIVITDTTPNSVFYLLQKRERPVAQLPFDRPSESRF